MFHSLALAMLAGLWSPAAVPVAGEAPATVTAPMPCSDYPRILDQLGARWAEQPISIGMQSNGNLLEVFASSEGNTWTIVSLAPTGTACVVAAGSDWGDLQPAAEASVEGGDGI